MRFERKIGFYEKYVKRLLDVVCSLLFIIVFCWLYAIIALIVRVKMGSPVLFKQPRPGIIKNGKKTIFDMYKFRSMTDKRDENGNLLPDDQRLPKFGAMLRSTSLDGDDIMRQTTKNLENTGGSGLAQFFSTDGRDHNFHYEPAAEAA